MENDFKEIYALSTEGSIKIIIDVALSYNEIFTEKFAEMDGFIERSFWTFLEHKEYWKGSFHFYHADNIPNNYWRKRKNLPEKNAKVDEKTIIRFESAIGKLFNKTQGRGKNCKVECFKRNNFDYFFAYPEYYTQVFIEWIKNNFERRYHQPAFEVVFVYSKNERILDIYLQGDKKLIEILQKIFTEIILYDKLGEDKQEDEKIYDYSILNDRHFQFIYNPDSGIEEITIRSMKLNIFGEENSSIVLRVNSKNNKKALYDLLD